MSFPALIITSTYDFPLEINALETSPWLSPIIISSVILISVGFLYLKKRLPVNVIRHSNFTNNKIKIVSVLAGSGAFAIDNAINSKADAFVTGDLKYHDFFKSDNKILLVDAGHFETEFFIKNKLQELLKEKIPNFAFIRSEINNNPVKYF